MQILGRLNVRSQPRARRDRRAQRSCAGRSELQCQTSLSLANPRLEWKDRDRSCDTDCCRSQRAVAPLQLDRFADSSRASAHAPPASGSTRACADAPGGCYVSLNDNGFPDRLAWYCAKTIRSTVFKNQCDGLGKIFFRLSLRAALPICPRHLGAIGNKPLPIALDYGGEFIVHSVRIPRCFGAV